MPKDYRIVAPNLTPDQYGDFDIRVGSNEQGFKFQLQYWNGSNWVDAPFSSINNANCRFIWQLIDNQVPETKLCESWSPPNICTNPYNSSPNSHVLTPTSGTSCFLVLTPQAAEGRVKLEVIVDDCDFGAGQQWQMDNIGTYPNGPVIWINIKPPLIPSTQGPSYNPAYCHVQIQGPAVVDCHGSQFGIANWNSSDYYEWRISDPNWSVTPAVYKMPGPPLAWVTPPSASFLSRHADSRAVWLTISRRGVNCIATSSSMRVTANCELTVIRGVRDWPAIFRNPTTIDFRPSPPSRF